MCDYYNNRLSYEEVAGLVERVSGERLLSDQKVRQIVSTKALKISQDIYKSMTAILGKNGCDVVQANANVDIYNPKKQKFFYLKMGFK